MCVWLIFNCFQTLKLHIFDTWHNNDKQILEHFIANFVNLQSHCNALPSDWVWYGNVKCRLVSDRFRTTLCLPNFWPQLYIVFSCMHIPKLENRKMIEVKIKGFRYRHVPWKEVSVPFDHIADVYVCQWRIKILRSPGAFVFCTEPKTRAKTVFKNSWDPRAASPHLV